MELPWKTGVDFAVGAYDEPVSWQVKPWIPEGGLTELTGEAKEAGKTTWILALCKSIINGWDFMGEPVKKCPVIFLTEQLGQSLKVQIREAELDTEEDFHILCWYDVWEHEWADLMEQVIAYALLWGVKLIVVDTLPQWAGFEDNAENMTSGALKAVRPLQIAGGHGIATLANRHPNRQRAGQGAGKSSKGSGSFKGAVDVVLDLALPEHGQGQTTRLLTALSRFEETPKATLISWNRGYSYTSHGPPQNKVVKSVDQLLNSDSERLTVQDVMEKFKMAQSTAYKWLGREAKAGRLVKQGDAWYRPD